MSEDRIERDTLIEASLERVWSLVSTPGFWVAEEAAVAGKVATAGDSFVAKNPNLGEVAVRVEKVDPPKYVAYRWASAFPGEDLRDDNSTLVEITLATEAGNTRLSVVETGFATLAGAEELRENALQFNTEGWPLVFDMLRQHVEQSVA
ncbi:SRPBCC domain-containing protein [Kribbella sp. NPDC023855]|uniref:SRPBCC domain-containing protein n=1 Tax=Kribbella sp. NPDC023855 TaxID=3154698 RepID=UPI0033E0E732